MFVKSTLVDFFHSQSYALISTIFLLKKIHLFQKRDRSVETEGVTRDENSCVSGGNQIQEIQKDGIKSQLNDKQIDLTGGKNSDDILLISACKSGCM